MIDLTGKVYLPIQPIFGLDGDEPLLVEDLARDLRQAAEGSGLVLDQVRFWNDRERTISLYVDGRLVASEDYKDLIEEVEVVGLLYFLNVHEIRASTVPS